MPRRTRRKTFSIGDIDITRREILFSVIILLVMLAVGFLISEKIADNAAERAEMYIKAVPIQSKEQFDYGMKTNIGNALVYGEFSAVGSVSYPELTGAYFAVEKHTERYTRHTRTVKDSDGNTKTETYHTWDSWNTDRRAVDSFMFMGNEYSTSKISIDSYSRVLLNRETVSAQYSGKLSGGYIYDRSAFWESEGDLRHYYYYTPPQFNATILVNLKDGSFYTPDADGKPVSLNYEKDIVSVVESAKNAGNMGLVVFWIAWIVLSVGAIIAFVYFDNNWLETR